MFFTVSNHENEQNIHMQDCVSQSNSLPRHVAHIKSGLQGLSMLQTKEE